MFVATIVVSVASYLLALEAPAFAWILVVAHLATRYFVNTSARSWWSAGTAAFIIAATTIIPSLWFFWGMMGAKAIGLWLVLIAWEAIPAVTTNWAVRRSEYWGKWALPFIWAVALYARCELYPLRFAMATPITPLIELSASILKVGGFGFVLVVLLCIAARDLFFSNQEERVHPDGRRVLGNKATGAGMVLLALVPMFIFGILRPLPPQEKGPVVVGVQFEAGADFGDDGAPVLRFLPEGEVIEKLDKALDLCPEAELMVAPEYALPGAPTEGIRGWCQSTGCYLVVGGKRFLPSGDFYNCVFVVNPKGEVEFSQDKVQPVPGLPDGLPAVRQSIWNSPWGKIGILVCYDLTLSRVTDGLVRQGAKAIICPAMDLETWGLQEKLANARFAPIRAAEYGIPVFRVASSGISQLVLPTGQVAREIGGDQLAISGELPMATLPRLPVDRFIFGWLPSLVRAPSEG